MMVKRFYLYSLLFFFFFQAEDGIRDLYVTGVQTCALPISLSQPFVALEAFGEGVLGGAGDTRRMFWATVPFNLMRVPLAWFLAIHLGWGAADRKSVV